jgi:hypothetical protein
MRNAVDRTNVADRALEQATADREMNFQLVHFEEGAARFNI